MSSWRLSVRIFFGLAVTVLFTLIATVLSVSQMSSASRTAALTSQAYIPFSELATQFGEDILNARIQLIYHVTIQKEGALQAGLDRYATAKQRLERLQNLVNEQPELASLKNQSDQVAENLKSYDAALSVVLAGVREGHAKEEQFKSVVATWAAAGNKLVMSSLSLQEASNKLTKDSSDSAATHLQFAMKLSATLLLGGLLLGSAIAMWAVRSVVRDIQTISTQVAEGALQVKTAAGEVSSSAQALAQGASEQAAALEQSASSALEVSSMTDLNAKNSKEAASIVQRTRASVLDARTKLEEMIQSMDEIKSSSSEISKIIKLIDEISFQTNILALNAAVEAARAGEAGMGFAVVADEVRNLAQRCTQAARDTSALIERSVAGTQHGSEKLAEVASAITGVVANSEQVKTLVDEVAMGAQEQAGGLQQITKALNEMESLTQRNAAGAEQGAAAGEELNAQASTLQALMAQLESLVHGASAATRSSAQPAYEVMDRKSLPQRSLAANWNA